MQDTYRDAVDRICARDPGYVEGTTDFRVSNAVEADPAVAELIDHPRHIGYAYDLYGEMLKIVRAGTMTVYDGNLWHRVEPNHTDTVRKNIFIAYCPSWVCAGDRLLSDPEWLATLNREQRIIMRSYPHPHDYTNPPAEDFPLFLDRETAADTDAGVPERIPLRLRKRRTAAERFAIDGRGGDR